MYVIRKLLTAAALLIALPATAAHADPPEVEWTSTQFVHFSDYCSFEGDTEICTYETQDAFWNGYPVVAPYREAPPNGASIVNFTADFYNWSDDIAHVTCTLGEVTETVAIPRDPTGETITGSISVTATVNNGSYSEASCRAGAGESESGEVLIDNAWYRFTAQG